MISSIAALTASMAINSRHSTGRREPDGRRHLHHGVSHHQSGTG
ncbi:hypothetical protein [Sinorhizobium medicae]|nr:hypothetical protein [Sinorhizobium medicae]